eukprot:1282097-Alexandrium_andersonii.AAC.1
MPHSCRDGANTTPREHSMARASEAQSAIGSRHGIATIRLNRPSASSPAEHAVKPLELDMRGPELASKFPPATAEEC